MAAFFVMELVVMALGCWADRGICRLEDPPHPHFTFPLFTRPQVLCLPQPNPTRAAALLHPVFHASPYPRRRLSTLNSRPTQTPPLGSHRPSS
ncbi:hypothetical protein B0T21DRAFT_18116 [Apiosordaria backusii]|uniref:Secreted protein n=1 Tax=Apiosordaria backusii TaxID=314023 RepID=A0AA40K6X3_9PEZI|nr:hypothetical protein B0T21DRAFT_18116 [Apiosordaria backusii]